MYMLRIITILVATVALAGCLPKKEIDQSNLCIYKTDKEAEQCKTGELSYFKANRWGNEQLPLNVAASYCDFNYEVIYNNSGVICVFTNARTKK
ncbi:hypothetical protein E1189_00790 [Sansalvadorimonas verongulae]|nr:hypothetical protein [Sansalvadorimonas verongulae]